MLLTDPALRISHLNGVVLLYHASLPAQGFIKPPVVSTCWKTLRQGLFVVSRIRCHRSLRTSFPIILRCHPGEGRPSPSPVKPAIRLRMSIPFAYGWRTTVNRSPQKGSKRIKKDQTYSKSWSYRLKKKTCTHKIHHVGDINKFTIPVMAVMAVM